jgi:hypothetical protein
MKVTINKEDFELRLGLGVFYILGKRWGLESYDDVLKRILTIFSQYADKEEKDLEDADVKLTFEMSETLSDIIISAIVANKNNGKVFEDIDPLDVMDFIWANISILPELLKELISSMPKPGNVNPANRKK